MARLRLVRLDGFRHHLVVLLLGLKFVRTLDDNLVLHTARYQLYVIDKHYSQKHAKVRPGCSYVGIVANLNGLFKDIAASVGTLELKHLHVSFVRRGLAYLVNQVNARIQSAVLDQGHDLYQHSIRIGAEGMSHLGDLNGLERRKVLDARSRADRCTYFCGMRREVGVELDGWLVALENVDDGFELGGDESLEHISDEAVSVIGQSSESGVIRQETLDGRA